MIFLINYDRKEVFLVVLDETMIRKNILVKKMIEKCCFGIFYVVARITLKNKTTNSIYKDTFHPKQ